MILSGDVLTQALQTPPDCRVRLWRLGGAGIALQSPEGLLMIDPFLAPAGGPGWVRREPPALQQLPYADIVLLTHEHDDHSDRVALAQLAQNATCICCAPPPSVLVAEDAGFSPVQTRIVLPGNIIRRAGFTIRALNVQDTDAQMPLAYHVTVDAAGWSLYHGGDAQMSSCFATTHDLIGSIDCCCLSVAGTYEGRQYYLTPQESVSAAVMLGARQLVPVHWDLWTCNGLPESTWHDPSLNHPDVELIVLRPGEALSIV